MGFGSYDESEQKHQQRETDDGEDAAVNVHQHEHDGEMTLENGASTDELLGQLEDIKAKNADEE